MVASGLSEMVRLTPEFCSLQRVGAAIQNIEAIVAEGKQIADYLCAIVPDEVIERFGVAVPPRTNLAPPSVQLRLPRGYEVHLFPSGNKHLMASDGTERYLNADRSPEVCWTGPAPASILLFTIDLANGLLDDVERFVGSLAG